MSLPKVVRAAPARADGDPQECHSLAGVDSPKNSTTRAVLKDLPSRVTLARQWPGLKVNRYTGAWRDEATGAKGGDIQSLLAFLREGSR